jgi:hypothetical protein
MATKCFAWACALLILGTLPSSAETSSARYEFAAKFIETLNNFEAIRDNAEKDMKTEGKADHLAGCVRNMEAFQLELNADVSALKAIQLSGRVKGVPQQFAEFFEMKRDLYRQMGDYCAQMIEGPKPGVDYGALAATAPKITARLDYIDSAIYKVTPLVFLALVSDKPDSQGHTSRLLITRSQMNALAQSIKLGFGKKLDMKDQNYTVGAASLLYFGLTKKDYRGSDE